NAGSTCIRVLKGFRLLPHPRRLECNVLIALTDAQGPWGSRGARTVRTPGARPTDRLTEGNTDGGMAVAIGALRPDDAPLPLRADRVFGVPIDHELGGRKAVPGLPLPALITHCRANKVYPVIRTTRPEVVGGDIAHIDDLFPRCELASGQLRLTG